MMILCVGPPGSGKSTWCHMYKSKYPACEIVSSDQVREDLKLGEYDPNKDVMVHSVTRSRALEALKRKHEVIVDSTNCKIEEILAYRNVCPLGVIFAGKVFDITPEECYRRISKRERKVPLYRIREKYDNLQETKRVLNQIFNFVFQIEKCW